MSSINTCYISIISTQTLNLKSLVYLKFTYSKKLGSNTMNEKTYQTIEVDNLPIRLGQFLKFANVVQDGMEAKIRIQEGEILLNGGIETRRGKQLKDGDIVEIDDERYKVRLTAK